MNKKRNKKKSWNNYLKTLLIVAAIVLFWRGVWGLMNLYFFPKNELLSFCLSIFAGLVLLYLLKHSWELLE